MHAEATSPVALVAPQVLWVFGPVTCVRYPLYEIEGEGNMKLWRPDRRRTVLQVLEKNQASALLYNAVIWRLLEDKWREFASLIFYWFVFCNLLSLAALTLALCTSSESREASSGMRALPFSFSCCLFRGRSTVAVP